MPKGYSSYNQGGWHHSEEVIEKMRIAALNRAPFSEATRQKLSTAHLGKHYHSKEFKLELSKRMTGKGNPMYGKSNSLGIRAKISATLKRLWEAHQEIREKCGRQGIPHTEEAKAKMRLAALANHGNSALQLGYQNHFYGKHHTIETKEKISMAKKGMQAGSQNPSWRGGRSFEPYPMTFNGDLKEAIRQRDNYLCQRCGVPQTECLRRLHIHHIDGNKENIEPANLISLCNSCHMTIHMTNPEYWRFYFSFQIAKIYAQEGGD